ncbi:hypothetical protein DFQ11_1174 [Winogradskyella epiphytica]|uniref:Uncharacterized protein n=1 Tax=Winogradskyella epiphytica TaxID=262005 RepID=A0A2V4XW23_9FLAO|nr:hypothetical protein [Winogradskyella epiphytica]PYE78793.1 hypothetical protein DFQ11_1174 [Winogradskyella epiphytica]GGW74909.1 hypothetical protein GCM10008085_28730 [Winogradskyella epiphytica]
MTKILFILIIVISINSYGQIEFDTIKFVPIDSKIIESIESSGMKVIDSLNKPKAFVLSQDTYPEFIALKKRKKFILFNLLPEPSYGTVSKIERKQVNGKNYEELIVYCDDTYGHSGLGGGLRITNKKILIYDLKKMKKIFDTEYFTSTYRWENDVTDSLTVASSTEYYLECSNSKIKIEEKKIVLELKENDECKEIDFSDYIKTKCIYVLKKNMFVEKEAE